MAEAQFTIEVVFAGPQIQQKKSLLVPAGTTAVEAIALVGWRDLAMPWRVGIHARPVAPDHRLADGDRLEIYRPLMCDPREARRRRAAR